MATKIVVPALGESVVEATVARWLKKEGDSISVGDALVELETEKIDLEVSAEKAGVLAKIERGEGEDVQVGDVLGTIEEQGGAVGAGQAPPVAAPAAQQPAPPAAPSASDAQRATPTAKKVAQEHGADLSGIPGSGADGRVVRQDVERAIGQGGGGAGQPQPAQPAQSVGAGHAPPVPQQPAASTARDPREERTRMSRRRQTIARRLVEAQQTAAMLTTFNEIDLTAVMAMRAKRKDTFKERFGVNLGFMSFFVKATIGALRAFPLLNAEIQGDELVVKRYYDIGIAIGAEEGLVVPVLRDADRLSFAQIEQAIRDYAVKVNKGGLSLEDLRGGTFTITNGGVFGSLMSTPILNPPQVGILGMHKIQERPIAVDGQVVIRPMMYVALSYDHRIVDGREAVQFLVKIKDLLEDPENLLLEG